MRILQALCVVIGLSLCIVAPTAADGQRGSTPSGIIRRIESSLRSFTARSSERNHRSVKSAFRDVVRSARQGTARVLCDGDFAALATVVGSDGYVLTKASELHGDLAVELSDGRRQSATLVARDRAYDLALLRVELTNLTPVSWSTNPPQVGAWLATAGMNESPTAIGVVSSTPRRIPAPHAALGVEFEESERGPRVTNVIPKSAAAGVKLRAGDVILRVDEVVTTSGVMLQRTIRRYTPGEHVTLVVQRGSNQLTAMATLSNSMRLRDPNEQAEIMDALGGDLSDRRSGFPLALQHDTVLEPKECGGPLVDLDGRVVGINIARSSRVASYAIPTKEILAILPQLKSGAAAGSRIEVLRPVTAD